MTGDYTHFWTHKGARETYEAPRRPPAHAPNIVIFLLDDTGFAELGCYGSEIRTPNIDRLAAEGLRFTNFHTTSLCSSSRAALLTGRNHHSVGMRMLSNVDTGRKSGRGRIHPENGTLAEILRPTGYNTMAVGKWHLAPMEDTSPVGPYDHWPLGKGFERFYGFLEAATDHYFPELTYDNHRIDPPARPEEGYHLTSDLVDHAIGFVKDQVSHGPDRPFFLYFGLGATHAPHQAPQEYIDAYRGVYDCGYDVIREQRYRRQLEMGIIPAGTALAPANPDVPAWDSLNESERMVAVRLQEAYAGFLTHTDDQVGRFLAAMEELGVADDTIVLLLSDNGAAMEGGPVGSVTRIRFFNGLPEDHEFNVEKIGTIGGPNGDNHYPRGWAQAGNTPCKWYKYHSHEGGIRDPLIMRWRNGISARGEIRSQYHHIIDVMPTLIDLAGVEVPPTLAGIHQTPVHGVSMVYSFDDPGSPSRRRVQYYEMFGNRAIYFDGWKAVARHYENQDYELEPWELYRIEEDFSETHDLAQSEPGRLQRMIALWHVEAGKYDVLPLDDRSVELFGRPPLEHSPFARKSFVFYDGISHVQSRSAPNLSNRSFRIDADIECDSTTSGFIVVHGNYWSGYGMYMLDGHAVFEYNFCGSVTRIVSTSKVSPVTKRVSLDFERTDHNRGKAALFIDDSIQGSAEISRTLTFTAMTGLDVGHNSHGDFSDHLPAPGRFQGTLKKVSFTLGHQYSPEFDPEID
jgi:arylsulfatase